MNQEDIYMLWAAVAAIVLFAWCCLEAGRDTSISLRRSDHDATLAAEDHDHAA